jgi:hypothetical protein
MARPMILIGIGTSGLRVLEETQRFHLESLGTPKPEYIEYIYLETNKDNFPSETQENKIKRVYISLSQMERMVKDLKSETESLWLPPEEQLVNAGMGAGGIRTVGRLALWGKNDEGSNFSNVFSTIHNAYQNVGSYTQKDIKDKEPPAIYIIGSLTGGTGSGIFIDMAYIVREIISNTKDVYGLFMIPNKPLDMSNNETMYANTYGALRDLENYNKSTTVYEETWPSKKQIANSKPPFELVHIISQDYKDGSPAIRTLPGLYKMGGLFMFLNIIGLHIKRMERLVDASGNFIIAKYATFGLSGIQYPKDQIQEFVASDLGIKLLERWNDTDQFIITNERQPINVSIIEQGTQRKWDDFLRLAFQSLNNVGGQDLVAMLESDAIRINKNEIGDEPDEFLRKQFGSKHTDKLYAQLSGNLQVVVNSLIESLYDFNNYTLNIYQSLYFGQKTLKGFADSITRCLEYWKSIGIQPQSSQWDSKLTSLVKWVLENRYKAILEQDNVLKDRILTVFELLKMHLIFPKLEEIRDYIVKHETAYVSTSDSTKSLPNLYTYGQIIQKVNEILGTADNQDKAKKQTLPKRQAEISTDINDRTIPILRVYQLENFTAETKNGLLVYGQKTNNKPVKHEDVTTGDLWEILKENSNSEIYFNVIHGYKKRVNDYDCIGDYNLNEYIDRKEHVTDIVRMAKLGLSGFISVDKTLDSNNSLPRLIISDEKPKIIKVLERLRDSNVQEFKENDNTILSIPELKNMLLFYDEKGNFIPIEDLSYIDQMKAVYDKKPTNLAVGDVTDEMWTRQRDAYFPTEKVTKK